VANKNFKNAESNQDPTKEIPKDQKNINAERILKNEDTNTEATSDEVKVNGKNIADITKQDAKDNATSAAGLMDVLNLPTQQTSGVEVTTAGSKYKEGDVVTIENIKYKLIKSKTSLTSILRQKYESKFGEFNELEDDQFFAMVLKTAEDESNLSPMELQDTLEAQMMIESKGNVYDLTPLNEFDPDTNPEGAMPLFDVVDNLLPDIVDKSSELSETEVILSSKSRQTILDFDVAVDEQNDVLRNYYAKELKDNPTEFKARMRAQKILSLEDMILSRKNGNYKSDEAYIESLKCV